MGMYDELYWEATLPPDHPPAERDFQTKSLFNALAKFTVTAEGRLILHDARYEPSGETTDGLPRLSRVPIGDIDVQFHGDMRITCTAEDRLIEYAIRFTHGKLEWIRPWMDLSETHQELIISRR